ncbi:hypothetical protein NIES4073_48300 [Kalymmatonema gypsitolerans NIES-4073]|nr:hypothetical protein NIES4073_48300 [Scytonema sp. NIES-4073]
MTKACNSDHHSQSPRIYNTHQWLFILSRGGIALSGILLIGIMGGAWRVWNFIHKDLVPLAQTNLTTTLNRPVQLGKVKQLSLTGVTFGASAIPATPTDPDKVTVEVVEVGFDPLQLLLKHKLKLDVTLVNPDVYLEQDEQRRWLTTKITPAGRKGPIKTDLDKLRFRNANLVLVPQPNKVEEAGEQKSTGAQEQKSTGAGESVNSNSPVSPLSPKSPSSPSSPVAFSQINGTAQLLENYKLIQFNLDGQPDNGGNLSIQGDFRPKTQEVNLELLRVRNFLAADVSRIVKLPVELQAGRVQGELKIQNIQLKQKQQNLLVFGTASGQGVQLQVPRMPLPFINSQGNVRFQGTELKLENVATGYGKIPLIANGTIDSKAGYKLAARVNSVNVASVRETLNVKLPVPTIGEGKADLQVVGSITNPILSGTVATVKEAKIDKVDFKSASAQFEFSPVASIITFKNIQGKATVGGEVTGAGTIQFVNKIPKLNFNVTAKNVPGDAIASVYDTKPAFQIGTVSGTAQLTGSGENVQTTVQWQAPQATYPGSGETIVAPDKSVSFRNVALSVAGGTVQIAGSWANERWQAIADASKVQVQRFVNSSQLQNVSLDDARFNGRLILSGTSAPFKIATIRPDNAKVQVAGGTVGISNIQFGEQSFSAGLVADGVRLGRLLKQAPQTLDGPLAGKFQVSGNTDTFNLKTLRATGEGRLLVAGGAITADHIQVAEGLYKAQLQANNVDVQQLAQLPKQSQGRLSGQFNVAGSVESFQPQTVVATGQARVNFGSGSVTASNIQLEAGRYQAQLQASNVPLQKLSQVPPQFNGTLTGQFNVAGLADSFKPQAIQATGQARLNVAGGTVTASNIQLADGRYQAMVDASGVELKRLSQQLRGQFGGKLQLAGTVGTFNISNVRASGQVQLSQGIAGIEQPLTAVVGWDGQKLLIERATSPGLNANGYILAKSGGSGIPEITELNLNVQAQNYNLQNLPMQLPSAVALAGKADFGGRISGTLPVPNIQGQVRLRDLVVNRLAFESVLTGNIQLAQGQGLNLDVAGKRDRITLNADAKNRGTDVPWYVSTFLVRWQDALASGQSQGDNLAMKVENFPLAILNLTPPANTHLGTGVIAGFLTGDFQVNQKTFATQGDIAIAKPQLGRIKGDRLMAQFRYGDGQATITNSEFVKGASRYALAGTLSQTPKGPQIKGKLNVTQGEVQDVLTALQLYELQDVQRGLAQPKYGTAADLNATESVGFSDQPLSAQLQRFGEFENRLVQQKQQRRNVSPIPELADLKGTFNGEISVDTATANGLDVSFNLNGQNFVWGRADEPDRLYKADQVIAQGRFENGVLRLLPLRLESQNNLIALTGNIGGNEQSGQLQVVNFPVQVLNNFVKLPVGFTGNLNGTAALAGSIDNPQAKGELQITQGTLNQKGVESATASFNYTNGRLNFGSHVTVSGSEPVKIAGSVPYQLPFASVKPDNDQINLDVKVQNEGLAVLNLLTNQVAFEKGEGQIDLMVRGTTQQPILDGIATLQDATFSSQALPGKLTDITGTVQFGLDRIVVQNLQGKYNNNGKVEAQGEIPVSSQETKIDHPLTVTLDQLALNLKELYQGGVSGNLLVTGSALKPMIGGKLQLADGQVLLAESTKTTNGNSKIDVSGVKQVKQETPKADYTATRFKDLQLQLGKNVQITRPLIISFRATGTLNVNGSFSEPIPEGTIRLKEGSVNLFTTRFNLARGYKHKAIFRANQPRDPELDMQLFAKVLDVIQNTDLNKPNITGLAALETVRVDARVQGLASKLDESLELTSSPVRSQTEIVALLGGGIVETEGRTNDTTLGLINIAGSAVFNNLQEPLNQIATALGLSELRLFPTILTDTLTAGRSSSTLELAAEAGVDITRRFSVSTLKILTNSDPFQWGINYRLNNNIRLRATTNLNDDNRAVVEYQKRF